MAMSPSNSAAITGTFCDYKLVKTRGVLQLIVEVAVEQQAVAFAALGYPMPGTEIPVAIARLDSASVRSEPERPGEEIQPEPQAEPGRPLQAMQKACTRAVMLCKDPQFQKWITQYHGIKTTEENAATCVRKTVGGSRSLIATNEQCYMAFLELEQEYRQCVG